MSLNNETPIDHYQIKASVSLIIDKSRHRFLIIRRTAHPKDPWSYQMALPGGKRDEGESLIQTAVRETFEECGLDLDEATAFKLKMRKAGRFNNQDLLVQPYLFEIQDIPKLNLNKDEVDCSFWINIDEFINPENHSLLKMSKNYPNIDFPVFKVEESHIWGFTYQVLIDYFVSLSGNMLEKQVFILNSIDRTIK